MRLGSVIHHQNAAIGDIAPRRFGHGPDHRKTRCARQSRVKIGQHNQNGGLQRRDPVKERREIRAAIPAERDVVQDLGPVQPGLRVHLDIKAQKMRLCPASTGHCERFGPEKGKLSHGGDALMHLVVGAGMVLEQELTASAPVADDAVGGFKSRRKVSDLIRGLAA